MFISGLTWKIGSKNILSIHGSCGQKWLQDGVPATFYSCTIDISLLQTAQEAQMNKYAFMLTVMVYYSAKEDAFPPVLFFCGEWKSLDQRTWLGLKTFYGNIFVS